MTYWHGGAPGLAPGDWLEPRSVTGVFRPYDVLGPLAAAGKGGWFARAGRAMDGEAERVYLVMGGNRARATAREFAEGYSTWLAAIGAPGAGWLYRVEPADYVRRDPTVPGGYSAPRARIAAVEEKDIPADESWVAEMGIKEMRACYELWRDEFNGGADRWPEQLTARPRADG